VQPPDSFSVTLTGRSTELRLRIENQSEDELRVLVRPSSSKLRFPSGDMLVMLEPAGATRVEIPVVARSNGTSRAEITLLTPNGRVIAGPVVVTAHVNAITGLGQVITGGAVLVLASWWGSHLLRRRRARRAAAGLAIDDGIVEEPFVLSPDAAEVGAGNLPDS